MGLKIRRKANLRDKTTWGPDSVTLQSACYEHLRLVGDRQGSDLTIAVATFTDGKGNLDPDSAKRLFDHIWKQIASDNRSNVVLELSNVRTVDPLFRTELTYLSGQLRRQRRFVRLSDVGLDGDWSDWQFSESRDVNQRHTT